MGRHVLLLTAVLALGTPSSGRGQEPAARPPFDVVVRNGRVLDGAGNPWIRADVAIRQGRIAKVGRVAEGGLREIDAEGLYVAPGFIDMMDQSGSVLPRSGLAENKLRMGVTTAIGGEGGTPVGVDSVALYFRGLQDRGISINFGSYFSATQARVAVLGNDARAPSPPELARMKDIMASAMRQGAMGMTTALIYPPSAFATTEELVTGYPGWWNIVEAAGGWDGIVLVNARNPELAHFEGKSLATVAEEWGKDPADAAWDLVAAGEGRVMAIYHMMSEDDVRWALQLPWTSVGSDAGAALEAGRPDVLGLPHPRSYGTFPRVLARYVRDEGLLTLEEAVRKMTSWPATRMRLEGRGILREGSWADVVVFDLDHVQDRATYEDPTLFPEGIEWVLVNGVVVIESGGHHTGALPGQVLYGPGAES
jgi:N-acyl-D-aspartate/D-glutamate deacylase